MMQSLSKLKEFQQEFEVVNMESVNQVGKKRFSNFFQPFEFLLKSDLDSSSFLHTAPT